MAAKPKKSYPLRVSQDVMDAMQRWSDDELRSLNAQIEYVLRNALRGAGRLKPPGAPDAIEEIPEADEAGGDEPFLVTRPSSEDEDTGEDIFPVKRPPS